MVDLANAMAPKVPHKIVGIRPGEKMHETMCPADDSHLTLEFVDHFVIKPTIRFSAFVDFSINRLNEEGRSVRQGFEYSSEKNESFLTLQQIVECNAIAGF